MAELRQNWSFPKSVALKKNDYRIISEYETNSVVKVLLSVLTVLLSVLTVLLSVLTVLLTLKVKVTVTANKKTFYIHLYSVLDNWNRMLSSTE